MRLSSPEEEYNWSLPNNLESQISKVHNKGKTRKDQVNTFEEMVPNKQKQKFIHGEPEVKKVKGEDSLSMNFDRVLNNNGANRGSKLLTRDKNEENYRMTQDIPRSLKFCSITDLYMKHTTRLSPVEDEYNWNLSRNRSKPMAPRGRIYKQNTLTGETVSATQSIEEPNKCTLLLLKVYDFLC
ncbi:hypothetical protein AABB24_021491 [Solanum stoloniferum]|uniref:Uncharacterized protein n=1 Tax=Solanum stoloniferum TaxID=62892 RepID=A0ABD2SVX8_9SOLN